MPQHILVVDDSASIRKMVEFSLKTKGFKVTTCPDGQEAYEQILMQQFALVILDVNMPRMDGFELLKRLRGNPDLAALPVVMLTTEGQAEDKERALAAGATEYMVKPFKPTELLETVQRVVTS